jgi:alginate O-acetyltransferase complex protein AlgI
MVFNSLTYFIFLPSLFIVFCLCSDRYRWLLLLLASVGFYATLKAPGLLAALAVVTMTSYYAGIRIGGCPSEAAQKRYLTLGILANLAVLCFFKYFNFIYANLGVLFGSGHSVPEGTAAPALISIGVSYFTFQAISYLIDIYFEVEEPERHLGYFALYLCFFPKILQGPIERAGDLLPQLKKSYQFDYQNMRSGLLLFAWGLFLKVAVADRLALFVNRAYDNVHDYSGLPLIVATYLYALQIFCDFSGYTNMALGTARLFNITLTNNFNSPYLATSIADFWRRWHISFSRWILDYIFKPLQMQWRDWKNWGSAAALLVTFLVSGLWHGSSWGFVVWGLLHGLYLSASVFYRPIQQKIDKKTPSCLTFPMKIWQVVITFNLVCFAWIFFRANTLSDAFYVVRHLFAGWGNLGVLFQQQGVELCISILGIVVVCSVSYVGRRTSLASRFFSMSPLWRWPLYVSLVITTILFNVKSDKLFIYFRF